MKISTILDHIDNGHMALPEFQRGYVWNRDQVRGLMDSLYRRHPVGSLLVWATQSEGAQHRGDGSLAAGVVKLLLDGQQRITSLYGIIRGVPPKFFDGNAQTFSGLRFHVGREEFAFYSPVHMKDDPLWIDVTELMQKGMSPYFAMLGGDPAIAPTLLDRLNRIHMIREIELHIEEVTGKEKTIDVVVDIFNRVNSGGTKLSKGDLALAKICADWSGARDTMKTALGKWRKAGYHFDLDWLLRNVNTIVTGEAKFHHLHDASAEQVQVGLKKAEKHIDKILTLISGRLGLDHDRVLFGRYAFPIMVRHLERAAGGAMDAVERDRLLFWYVGSAMWGRFSGSTESVLDKDLALLEDAPNAALDQLVTELQLWHGSMYVQPDHFAGWSLGARFYPVLYMLSCVWGARDFGDGIEVNKHRLGKMNALEVHHIFPKTQLYKHKNRRPDVNAIANFCYLTKETNLAISNRLPEDYFPEVEAKHPGALASQWIPTDTALWKIENYQQFLAERRRLLAEAANGLLADLYHGEIPAAPARPASLVPAAAMEPAEVAPPAPAIPGGIDSEEEEEQLRAINTWIVEQGLPEGICPFELVDSASGAPAAMLDLAWPNGLQKGFSQPVALLLDEPKETLETANDHGFRYFTDVESFRRHVEREVLARIGENEQQGAS